MNVDILVAIDAQTEVFPELFAFPVSKQINLIVLAIGVRVNILCEFVWMVHEGLYESHEQAAEGGYVTEREWEKKKRE